MQIEQLFWIAVGLGAASAALALYLAARLRAVREALDGQSSALTVEQERVAAAAQEARENLRRMTEAETRLEAANALLDEERRERARLTSAAEVAASAREAAERSAALARQQVEAEHAVRADWEKAKAEFMTVTRAAVMQTASDLSNKLLADHKRENTQAKEEAEKRVKETTALLMQQYERVTNSMGALDQQVRENRSAVETITRALSSPGGAGQHAETVLENTLKS